MCIRNISDKDDGSLEKVNRIDLSKTYRIILFIRIYWSHRLTLGNVEPWAAGIGRAAGGSRGNHRGRKIQQVWKLERERDGNQTSQHPEPQRQRRTGRAQQSTGGRHLQNTIIITLLEPKTTAHIYKHLLMCESSTSLYGA